jgi:hypothetical protein
MEDFARSSYLYLDLIKADLKRGDVEKARLILQQAMTQAFGQGKLAAQQNIELFGMDSNA